MIDYPNAKINIGLNIIEKRPDGYHNIETVFYPIAVHDILEIDLTPNPDYKFSVSGIAIAGNPEDNLIIKAYRILQKKYNLPPVEIVLIKNIPFGAGLGGGSSDAAFTLKMLNTIFKLNISVQELENLASELGADCSFFIQNKPVFASGIGNIFSSIDLSLKGLYLLLVKPDIHVSTPEAYSLAIPQKPEISLKELVEFPVKEWKNLVRNDFETSVFNRYQEIGHIKDTMYQAGALYASMSGSGSSVYGIFENKPPIPAVFNNYFTAGSLLD